MLIQRAIVWLNVPNYRELSILRRARLRPLSRTPATEFGKFAQWRLGERRVSGAIA
jgi:hypothetical protein